jgi:hypothetical protein
MAHTVAGACLSVRVIDRCPVGRVAGAQLGDLTDERREVAAEQRFAAGKPHLLDAERDEDADDAQVIGERQLAVLGAIGASAAVDTAVVAAVCDGDAQVGDGAAVAVGQAPGVLQWGECGSGRDGLCRHSLLFDAFSILRGAKDCRRTAVEELSNEEVVEDEEIVEEG